MQPRPRFPMQRGMGPWGMGPNPFAGGQQPMMGQGLNLFGSRTPMPRPPGSLFGGRSIGMGGPQMNRGGGGFLSRLFARKGPAGMQTGLMGIQGAERAGGGLLQSLTNPSGITSFLNNTQQVIKTAQTITPMIQQYGPIVKNLPALWKLYRGLKNTPEDEKASVQTTGIEESSDQITAAQSEEESSSMSGKMEKKQKQISPKRDPRKGTSVPKLYI